MRYLETLSTPSVKAAQDANGSEKFWTNFAGHRDFAGLTDAEAEFIALRDSFYVATISENGWALYPAPRWATRLFACAR